MEVHSESLRCTKFDENDGTGRMKGSTKFKYYDKQNFYVVSIRVPMKAEIDCNSVQE
jgi:hypothetical protein